MIFKFGFGNTAWARSNVENIYIRKYDIGFLKDDKKILYSNTHSVSNGGSTYIEIRKNNQDSLEFYTSDSVQLMVYGSLV